MTVGATEEHEWLRRARLVIVEAPFYMLDLQSQAFDAAALVRRAEACHANVIRLGAARTYAFFQSKIAPHAPALGDRDFLREVLDAAKPRGIKVVPYIQSGYENALLYREHPNWVSRLADGRPMAVGRPEEFHMCWNSPYRQWKISIIKEIAGNYEIDGLYNDGPTYFGYCHCNHCRQSFHEEFRMDIPRAEDWRDPAWQEYVLWRYRVLAFVLRDICEAVRTARPGIPVLNNNITYFHERCRRESRIPEVLTRVSDGMLLESHRTHQRLPWNRVGQNAKYGFATGKPLWMWWEYNVGDWSFAACSDSELKLKYAEIRANGGAPGVFPFDVTERAGEGLRAIGDCFAFQERNEERLFSANPVKFAALPYSRQTAEWYGAAEPDTRYTATHTGLYRCLVHNHVPFNLLLDPDLTHEGLAGYQILVLSNLACLSSGQAAAIRQWVANGGGLLATYETSLWDERGRKRPNFALADVFGADYVASPRLEVRGQLAPGYAIVEERDQWVMWLDEPVTGSKAAAVSYIAGPFQTAVPFDESLHGTVLPVGRHTYVTPRQGATGVARLLSPSQRSNPLGGPTAYPGAVTHRFGKGRVVYFPADLGQDYSQVRVPHVSRYLVNALQWVAAGPWPIQIEAPSSVEVQIHTGADRTIIYLINFTSDSLEPGDEVTSVSRLTNVAVRAHVVPPVDRVLWLNRQQELDWRAIDGHCAITLPELDEYAVLSIEHKR